MPDSEHRACAACTIVSKNYFAYAKTLADSFLERNPAHDFYILVVDRTERTGRYSHPGVKVVFLEDLELPDWLGVAFRFDVVELNTNVKATMLRYLLRRGYQVAFYFDPDMYCYQSVAVLRGAIAGGNVLLTPHAVSPYPEEDGRRPMDRDLLRNGAYNLGFIGVSNSPEGERFLAWWEARCLGQGFNEPSYGLFVDQKWIDLVPSYFDGVVIFKHAGCNMAYWNIHERSVIPGEDGGLKVRGPGGDVDLVFFHFSGIDPLNFEAISTHQNRFNLQMRPDLRDLLVRYSSKLLGNGYESYKAESYGFATFSNGDRISPLMRRYRGNLGSLAAEMDPFSAESRTYRFAVRHRLISRRKGKGGIVGLNSLKVDDSRSRSLRVLGVFLRAVQYVAGADGFEIINKIMKHYGVPNNQVRIMFRE